MRSESKLRYILYCCIPLFLAYALYGQMQSVKVIDMHNAIESKSTAKDLTDKSSISTFMVFIPAIGPYLEVNSITTLFSNMKLVTEENSTEASYKTITNMFNAYVEESKYNDVSLYLYLYDNTLTTMLEFFDYYTTMGPDSDLTQQAKNSLSQKIKILQVAAIVKTIAYILLCMGGLIGFFVFKGRYSSKSMHN